ncbi:hypothetical protein ANO14919_042870 [Xylariales sp. No.14919]|nr:hypothetical protein ANO14919_042870 [Xylariales sp. No.14919]
MAYQGSPSEFPYFKKFPAELRQLIWKESVLATMNNPEVCILVPGRVRVGMYSINPTTPFPHVNTAFPVAVHVNREARRIALLNLKMADLGPYPWDKCRVPQRPFRPEIDTLYAARSFGPDKDFSPGEVAEVQHLALDVCDRFDYNIQRFVTNSLQHMPALRTLRLVLPTVLPFGTDVNAPCLPHRRCALRPVDEEKLKQTKFLPTLLELLRHLALGDISVLEDIRSEIFPSGYTARSSRPWPSAHVEALQIMGLIGRNPGGDLSYLAPPPEPWDPRMVRMAKLKIEFCLITEFCYSPSGGSRYVAVGEDFPDTPDPSIFTDLNAPNSRFYV